MNLSRRQFRFHAAGPSLLLVFALAGCAIGAPDSSPATPDEMVQHLRLSIEVTGEVRARVSEAMPVRTIELSRTMRSFLMETHEWLPAHSSAQVKVGFLLTEFRGDGIYTIGSKDGRVDGTVASFSRGWVEVRGEDRKTRQIYEKGQCRVELKSGGEAGSLTCRELRSRAAIVAVSMEWMTA